MVQPVLLDEPPVVLTGSDSFFVLFAASRRRCLALQWPTGKARRAGGKSPSKRVQMHDVVSIAATHLLVRRIRSLLSEAVRGLC